MADLVDKSLSGLSVTEAVELADKCMHTQAYRKTLYEKYRKLYYQGSEFEESEINRIYGDINGTLALTYSPEHLILEGIPMSPVDVEDPAAEAELAILDEIGRCVKNNFFHRRLDLKSSALVLAAFVDGTAPVKAVWRGGGVDYEHCPAESFGVAYESLDIDDENQVFTRETELTENQVKRWYPEKWRKINSAAEGGQSTQGALKVFLAGGQNNQQASIESIAAFEFRARTAMKTFTARELYQFEFDKKQWRKTTMIGTVIVSDFVIGSTAHSWFTIKPLPITGNFWGMSAVQLIMHLQKKRDDLLDNIENAVELEVNPPLVFTGFNLGTESMAQEVEELKKPGGFATFNGTNAKVEPWAPKLDIGKAFEMMQYLDNQSKYIMGKNEVLMGESQKNVRGQGYASMLAQFASTDLKRVAHTVEAQLEEIFTYTGVLFQINDGTVYTADGRTFRLAQWAKPYRIEIYAHTGSPITTENNVNLAMALHKQKVLPSEVLLEIIPLPYKNKILDYLKKQEKAQALQAAQQQQSGQRQSGQQSGDKGNVTPIQSKKAGVN